LANIDPEKINVQAEIKFKQFCNADEIKEVISNKNFPLGDWNKLCKMEDFFEGVAKKVIPIDLLDFCMMVVTEVEPETQVPMYCHEECIFRFIMEGSLTLNGVDYKAGDWLIVPEEFEYEIYTKTGYKALASYRMGCNPPE